ncbi:MAG TPA: rRNA maturation RNase YbeY [Opitutaceae bacterium]
MTRTKKSKAPPAPTGELDREVTLAQRHPRLTIDRRAVLRVIALLDAHATEILGTSPAAPRLAPPPGALSLVFLSDEALAQLHADFLDDPTTTDVITFEGQPAFGLAGEICVSADTAARYAADNGGDFATELTLYVVHGWLHLAGHDDLQPAKKRAMRRSEARALKLLRAENAIPAFRLRPARIRRASRPVRAHTPR